MIYMYTNTGVSIYQRENIFTRKHIYAYDAHERLCYFSEYACYSLKGNNGDPASIPISVTWGLHRMLTFKFWSTQKTGSEFSEC